MATQVALNMEDNDKDKNSSALPTQIITSTVTPIQSKSYQIENIKVEDNPYGEKEKSTYDKLLDEFTESRTELKKMLKDIEECKDSVLKSVSDSSDYRNKYAREERLKTLSTFFGNMLQVRQEYNRSIQTEIELRRKLDMQDDGEIDLDIRSIAKQLSNLKKN